MDNSDLNRISYFPDSVINEIGLPERFTFPFYYEPHPLTKVAAAELQRYLETQTDFDHHFGLTTDGKGIAIGKMFGVLVVADKEGRVGYLSAFSGKLANSNDHPEFVPPVFDMLAEDSFFLKEQLVIDAVNTRIDALLADATYIRLKQHSEQFLAQAMEEIAALKKALKSNKDLRKVRREAERKIVDSEAYALFEAALVKESFHDQYMLKVLKEQWAALLEETQNALAPLEARIEALRNERRERSGALQAQLFDQYSFLNIAGKSKSLQDIFTPTAFGKPPAAAGECATPKLLQFAFANGYKPLAMAEFWWGASPKSDIRKHKQFYPACTGKCKPILAHMLEGMPVDENPFLLFPEENNELNIVYEDDSLVVINKPAGLRSVPGVNVADSVYSRLKSILKNAEPFMIHRLDMDTSGLLVVAKTAHIHKHIQKQFLNRTVKKRYTALLSKVIDQAEGEINLPLCADPFNRPRQLVCFHTGKTSITRWKAIDVAGGMTRVHFWPLTGRTHQLRMHAAHELGLNAPIAGDDLYGVAGGRLFLHAAHLSFVHPKTKEMVSFEAPEEF